MLAQHQVLSDQTDQLSLLYQERLAKMLKERQQQMLQLHREMLEREPQTETTCYPVDIILSNYQQLKETNSHVYSPPLYTHPKGYHFKMVFWLNGILSQRGSHMSVWIISIEDDCDDVYYDTLPFPVKFTVTVQLLNQEGDHDHVTKQITCRMPREASIIGYDDSFITHSKLEQNNEHQTIQYTKDDGIKLRVVKITML